MPLLRLFTGLVGFAGAAALLWWMLIFTMALKGHPILPILGGIIFAGAVWGAWRVDRMGERAGSTLPRVGCLLFLIAVALLSGVAAVVGVLSR